MKHPKQITTKTIKAGPHIRAVVNFAGDFWIEYLILVGVPYKTPGRFHDYWKMRIYDPRTREVRVKFVADLGADLTRYTRLFKYSSKLWNQLSTAKDVFQFMEIGGQHFSDVERERLMKGWGMWSRSSK